MKKGTPWRETMKCEDEPVLTLSLCLPEFGEDGRSARRIGRYYTRMGELWKARWAGTVYPRASAALQEARAASRPFRPWAAELNYTVTLEEGDILSLYLEITERVGAARPLTVRCADTWDLTTGTPLFLGAFLPRPLRGKKRLLAELKAQAARRLEGGESLFFQDVEERVAAYFSPRRFYLTQDGIALFFPMLSLGSAAEGVPVFYLQRERHEETVSPEKS